MGGKNAIGRTVAAVGNSLDKRQGVLVALGFIIGCLIWLGSWLLDIQEKGSVAAAFKGSFGISLKGSELREKVASWLIDASSTIAIILAYIQVTGRNFDQFRARHWLKGHVIICGFGEKSQILADSLLKEGKSVVVIDTSTTDQLVAQSRQNGLCVIHGDATKSETLTAAGFGRAVRLVCLTGSDEVNCAIVEACRSYIVSSKKAPHPDLSLHCHIQNLYLRQQLGRVKLFANGIAIGKEQATRVRMFSIEQCAAIKLLETYPPERFVQKERQQDDVHLLIVGEGEMVPALLRHCAAICHYWRPANRFHLNAAGVKVTLAGEGMKATWESLTAILPAVDKLLTVDVIDQPLESAEGSQAVRDAISKKIPTQVFVTSPKAEKTLSRALQLLEIKPDGSREGWPQSWKGVIAAIFPPRINPIDLDDWSADPRLQSVDLYSACSSDVVLEEALDAVAKQIYFGYWSEYLAPESEREIVAGFRFFDTWLQMCVPPEDQKQVLRVVRNDERLNSKIQQRWSLIDEPERDTNRAAATHFGVKLRLLGKKVVYGKKVGGGAEAVHLPEEMRRALCDVEHRRWMADRLLAGFTYAPVKNISLKKHNLLIPFADLDEKQKNKDDRIVDEMEKLLRRAGYHLADLTP